MNDERLNHTANDRIQPGQERSPHPSSDREYDVAVVGAGAAGTSAALFAARGGLRTVLIDDGQSGVQRAMLYNHPPLAEGISGPDYYRQSVEQATKAGATLVQATIVAIRRPEDQATGTPWLLECDNGQRVQASAVILCTGKALDLAKQLGLGITAGRERRYPQVVQVDADGRTSLPGIWAAGALAGASPHTIVVAGHGAQVAINIVSEKKGQRWVDHDVLPALTHA